MFQKNRRCRCSQIKIFPLFDYSSNNVAHRQRSPKVVWKRVRRGARVCRCCGRRAWGCSRRTSARSSTATGYECSRSEIDISRKSFFFSKKEYWNFHEIFRKRVDFPKILRGPENWRGLTRCRRAARPLPTQRCTPRSPPRNSSTSHYCLAGIFFHFGSRSRKKTTKTRWVKI